VDAVRGTLIAPTTLDGVRRIYAFHRVQDYPLFVVLGVSEPVALAPVLDRQRYYFLIAALASLALLLTASGLALLWQRQQQSAEEALGENREQLRRHNEMLVAVSETQAAYLARGDWKAATARLLRFALEQSDSEYGFVGVVVGGPKLRILAHEGIVWDEVKGREFYEQAMENYREFGYFEFSNFDNLFGAAIRSGEPVVSNDVSKDPRSTGLPDGHTPMTSFLGLPIRAGDRVIGVVGLANRFDGYDAGTLALLKRLMRGLAEPVCDSYLLSLEQERLRAEQRHADEQIRAALEEKEVLLKEVHHRVKNNLQVISSLLYLQANSLSDGAAREVLRDTRERVNSIALVHEQLYRSANFSAIDFGEHLRELAANVAYSHGAERRGIALEMKVMEVNLQLDVAIPASLIFNELLSNAFKHAFPGNRTGRVEVTLYQNGSDDLVLRVSDDGAGLPDGLDWNRPATLGLKIVRNLTEQIHGRIDVAAGAGSSFQVSFKANKSSPELSATL
jgi:two-component sensor histidine kinase